MIKATVIADSISSLNHRVTTLELEYPRIIHGEVMTHRVFSRNAMSSRAVPVAKMLKQVRNDPFMPVHWGANQPGMQADNQIPDQDQVQARSLWSRAATAAAFYAEQLQQLGLHKQIANRLLEPFQWMRTIVTATEWDNFFSLRCHPDAEPHFQALAYAIREARDASTPVLRQQGDRGCWHMPYISDDDRFNESIPHGRLMAASAARCARVSYLNHDGSKPDLDADLALFERLAGSTPIHASPLEHVCAPVEMRALNGVCANLAGWVQLRFVAESSPSPEEFIAAIKES